MGSIYANRIVRDNTVQYWFVSMWNPLLKAIINNIAFFSLLHSSHVHIAPTPSIIVLRILSTETHTRYRNYLVENRNKTETQHVSVSALSFPFHLPSPTRAGG